MYYLTIFLFVVGYSSSWRHKLRESDSKGSSQEIQASHMTSPSIFQNELKRREKRFTSKSDTGNYVLGTSTVTDHQMDIIIQSGVELLGWRADRCAR